MEKNIYPITIKIRVEQGCFCPNHSPIANKLIDKIMYEYNSFEFEYHHHESGPEIIAWLALGTAGLTVNKSLIDLITAIINACKKGKEKNDNLKGKLLLIVRDTHRTKSSTEEIVLEIYDNDIISPEQIQKVLEKGIDKKQEKKKNGNSKKT